MELTKEQILGTQKIADNFVKSLTKEELEYCTNKDRGENFGFSALHDLMDANVELLDTIEKLNLQAPNLNQDGIDFLNKCIARIDEKLTTNKKENKTLEDLQSEYTDWLVANLPREYVENQDCSAEAILFESLEGGEIILNDNQTKWLNNFCNQWDKAMTLPLTRSKK